MPRCYMVKKQINKYQNSNREFWDEGVASNASPDSPTEACVAPNYYNPPSSQPNNSEEPTESHLKKNEPPPPPPPPPLPPPPPPSDIFRSRSIEETEAAHDLLSLSQSLPPLPAPGAVTIHQTIDPVTAATHYYSPLTPDATPSPPISVPIPCYQQAPIVYVVQVPTVPTVPTPPTSECSSDAENQLLSLSSAAEAFVKQQQHPQQGQVQHVIYGGEGGKQEEIFIMPLSPEPERQQEVVVTTATVGTETDAEGVEIVGKVIPGGLCIPDKRTKKLCRKRADRMHGEQEEKFYTVTDEVENEEDYDDSEISPTLTANLEVKTLNRYVCNECGKKYATSSNLSRHKQTHRSLDSQSARKCMTCGKAYVSMPALAMHVLTHKLAHSCGICGKQFSRPWLLQGHLRSHSGEKPYGCAHCGKAFADRSNLRAHMQTHSQDKKFRCTNCRKTFALKSYLNKHQESACQATDEKEEEVKVVCTVGTNTNM